MHLATLIVMASVVLVLAATVSLLDRFRPRPYFRLLPTLETRTLSLIAAQTLERLLDREERIRKRTQDGVTYFVPAPGLFRRSRELHVELRNAREHVEVRLKTRALMHYPASLSGSAPGISAVALEQGQAIGGFAESFAYVFVGTAIVFVAVYALQWARVKAWFEPLLVMAGCPEAQEEHQGTAQ